MEASLGDSEPRADGAGEPGGGRLDAAPGLARIAAGAWLRTAGWTAGVALRAGRRTVSAAISGENPLELIRDVQIELIDGAQRLLGVSELEQRLGGLIVGRNRASATSRFATAATRCCTAPRSSASMPTPIRPTRGSSASSHPTRRASCD